jgi:hypothetical protein
MKKIFTLFAVAAIASSAVAQRNDNPAPAPLPATGVNVGTPVLRGQTGSSRSTMWYNYALMVDDQTQGYTPGMAAGDFMNLFPDTTIIYGQYTDGSTAYPQFHKAATMLDPKNMPYNSWSTTTQYKLDSVAIAYAYLRNLPTNIVDTLVVQVIKYDASLEWDLTNASYQDITYDYTTNSITPSQVLGTYTYLLNESDSSSYVNEIAIATPGIPAQAGSNRIGVVVSYKPGFTWTITDSLFDKNAFFIFSYEQNGVGTDPSFYGTIGVGTSDYNCSYALPSSVRYNTNASGWNGYFIPEWAWTTPYAYENHIISFLLNDVVGVDENSSPVTVANAFPNPAGENSFVDYNLQSEENVVINVTDVTGKVVMTINEGNMQAGNHRVQLNTADLAAGTYFIHVTAGAANATSKLVVMH